MAAAQERVAQHLANAALVYSVEALLLDAIRKDQSICAAINPRKWGNTHRYLMPSRVRSMAIYIAAVEIEIPNADLARALWCTRMNIYQVRIDIEEIREDGGPVDRLIEDVVARLRHAAPRGPAGLDPAGFSSTALSRL